MITTLVLLAGVTLGTLATIVALELYDRRIQRRLSVIAQSPDCFAEFTDVRDASDLLDALEASGVTDMEMKSSPTSFVVRWRKGGAA